MNRLNNSLSPSILPLFYVKFVHKNINEGGLYDFYANFK